MPDPISDQLRDEFIPHVVDLSRLSETERRRVLVLLEKAGVEINKQIQEANLEGKSASVRVARLEALRKEVADTIATAYKTITTTHLDSMVELADFTQLRTVKTINDAVRVEIASVTLTPGTLRTIASKALIEGHPAADWWKKQSADLQRNFLGQMRIGLVAGETNQQLARRINGTATGNWIVTEDAKGNPMKAKEFAGGIMDISRREATALVRTSAQAVSQKTNMKVFEGNSSLLRGYQAVVTLDLRTTPLCMSRSGGAWDLEGNPLPESEVDIQFPGPTPWHWGCRTTIIPLLKSWKDLLKEAGRKTKAKLEDVPIGTQSSMDGQVAGDLTYEAWLKKQSTARQNETLGPARAELFRKGKLTLAQLVDPAGRTLTLKQLRETL